jgi:hypothetical protein
MVALYLSHMGEMSSPASLSLSPCWKNSSMMRSTQRRYSSSGLVGLERSAQWTMFCSTCTYITALRFPVKNVEQRRCEGFQYESLKSTIQMRTTVPLDTGVLGNYSVFCQSSCPGVGDYLCSVFVVVRSMSLPVFFCVVF